MGKFRAATVRPRSWRFASEIGASATLIAAGLLDRAGHSLRAHETGDRPTVIHDPLEMGSVPGFMRFHEDRVNEDRCILGVCQRTSARARSGTSRKAGSTGLRTGRRVNKPSIWRLDPKSGKTENWSVKRDVGALALRRRAARARARRGFHFFDFQRQARTVSLVDTNTRARA